MFLEGEYYINNFKKGCCKMAAKSGNLSINSENIFPIIKKWLYSDHDIFYRELISNGCDAVTKLGKLDMMGEYTLPENYKARVDVVVDPAKKTLAFTDNGLGMTAEEVEEYINQQCRPDHRTFWPGILFRVHGSGRGAY